MRAIRDRQGPANRRLLVFLTLLALCVSALPLPATDAMADAGSPDADAQVEVDENGIPPSARDDVLGAQWSRDGDEAHVVLNGADGLTVLTAQSSNGYAWEATAALPVSWADTDLWVSNSCVTSSGDYMAVVYAPRAATNSEDAFAGGAQAAIVDLRSSGVTDLGTGYTISYFNPGCGAGDTVTFTRFEAGFSTTRIAVVDATSGTVLKRSDLDGLATSAVSRADGTILAVRGNDLVSIAPTGERPEVLLESSGTAYNLAVDDQDRLAYVTLGDDRQTATAYVVAPGRGARSRLVGTGPVTQLAVRAARGGGFLLSGQDVRANIEGVDGVKQVPEAGPGSVISSTGALVVNEVRPAGLTQVAPPAGPEMSEEIVTDTAPQVVATVVETGTTVEFTLDESQLAAPAGVSSTAGSTSPAPSGDALTETRLASASHGLSAPRVVRDTLVATAGDQHDPVEAERYCAVPRNDPNNQAYQPKPRQVEWAVDRAVKGQLTETRPANWRNLGMPAYSAQGLFPKVDLVGAPGATIPPQVVLGVLMQESNLWQASRYTAPGNTGNPLIGDFYGYRSGTSIWDIDYTEADCGYGVGQITDGMRLAGHERTDPDTGLPIETALPYQQQRAIALDYTANVAMTVRMLGQKWNQLANAGMLLNDGNPAYIENWFLVTWAYNSGFHPYSDSSSPWGVGWFNNPINTIYSPTRTPFLEAGQGDAAEPQLWPYPEKVIGWAAYGTSLVETQYANLEARTYESRYVSSFRTAWWNTVQYRTWATPPTDTFCDPAVNDCDPGASEPCQLSTSTEHYYECWWHEPASWKNSDDCATECGHGLERFPSSYATEASSMASSLPALTLQSSFLPDCQSPPSGTVVVDDTIHPDARNSGECTHRTTTGSFEFTFGGADSSGYYPAKVDLHQQGGGFNAHFYFAHMQDPDDPLTKVTGTWSRGADMNGTWTRVWVHLPDYAAWTQQAGYTINLGDGTSQTRYLPQRRYVNEWVSLGVFQMKGSPSVSLSNTLAEEDPTARFGIDIAGYDDIAWDAVGFQPLPDKPDEFVVALGDSYASGEGAGDYAPWSDNNGGTTVANNTCHQSANAWIRKTMLPGDSATIGDRTDSADTDLDFHFVSCSGAQSEHLLPYYSVAAPRPVNAEGESGRYGQSGMVSQLDAGYLDENTTLVALSVGGNDMRFPGIVAKCVIAYYVGTPENPFSADCSDTVLDGDTEGASDASAARLATELPASLSTVLQLVRERAPNARIAVLGYPKLFETDTVCLPVARVNQDWLNDLADSLNETIGQVAEAANQPGEPEIFFVNPQTTFTGHNLCTGAGVSGINGLQFTVTPAEDPLISHFGSFVNGQFVSRTSVHPNELGTSLYAEALEEALAVHP